jgi:hypothetical protein
LEYQTDTAETGWNIRQTQKRDRLEYLKYTEEIQGGISDRHIRETGWNIRQTQQRGRVEYQTGIASGTGWNIRQTKHSDRLEY